MYNWAKKLFQWKQLQGSSPVRFLKLTFKLHRTTENLFLKDQLNDFFLSFHMLLKPISYSNWHLWPCWTFIWVFTTVKMLPGGKYLPQETVSRFLSCMKSHMNFQVTWLGQGLGTHRTRERLLPSVNPLMPVQIKRWIKRSRALWAAKWFLTWVNPFMFFQTTLITKRLVTLWTAELFPFYMLF